ncbi:TRAP transporter small permease [Granulosicoccus sp. 3-233]|uniref:TRAP transporter small permease n=1 Tax=Granulosicoccus sp. 3-233 TaxID=3417969 RepID=UPI003D345F67
MNIADRLSSAIAACLNVLIGLMLLVMCSVTVWQVFARYVLNDASSWSEEVARIMMIWIAMLGSAVLIKSGGHITVTVLLDRVSDTTRQILLMTRDLFMLFTLSVMTWSGFGFARMNAVQLSAAMDIPLSWVYAALWIGSGLMIVMLVLVRQSSRTSDWTSDADGFE